MPARHPLPKVWRTIRWPVLISVVVLVVRLAGELMELDPAWFAREAGGRGSIVGVFWLIPLFGFAFGWYLTGKRHAPDRPGLSIVLHLLGLAALIAGVALVFGMGELEPPIGYAVLAGAALVSLAFAWRGWRELLRYTLGYGLVVRIAVLAITGLAVLFDWDTHFTRVPEEMAAKPRTEQLIGLCVAQLTIWVPGTVLIGGAFGSVASLIRGRHRDDAQDQ